MTVPRHGRRRLPGRRSESGAAAVEFALFAALLFVLLMGIAQYGMYFLASQAGSAAARETVRRAAVGACTDDQLRSFFIDRVDDGALAGDDSAVVVERSFFSDAQATQPVPAPGVVGGLVRVHVAFPTYDFPSYDFGYTGLPFPTDAVVSRTVDARLENTSNPGAC